MVLVRLCILLLVMSVPFTWSYLTSFSGLLIRPFDLLGLIILFASLAQNRFITNRVALIYLVLFAGLVFWIAIGSIWRSEVNSPVAIFKITFYFLTTFALSSFFSRNEYFISAYQFNLILLFVLLSWALFRTEFFIVIMDLPAMFGENPKRALFIMANRIFSINLFGPLDLIEIRGVSFRNTASLGFLTVAIFVFGFMKNRFAANIIMIFFLLLTILFPSRTTLACAFLFFILLVAANSSWKSLIYSSIIIVIIAGFLVNDVIISTLIDRFSKGSGGRGEMNILGLIIISENFLFGAGSETTIEHFLRNRNVHNIPIALGSKFGFPAFFIAGTIILLNIYSFFFFLFAWWTCNEKKHKRAFATFTVAALIIAFRPNVSSSVESFYSLPEWICFSLILFGYSYVKALKLSAK